MKLIQRQAVVLAAVLMVPAFAQQQKIGEVTLFGEEQLKVEAATKTEIPISKAPASVTVITAKQIRESGARTLAHEHVLSSFHLLETILQQVGARPPHWLDSRADASRQLT